MRCVVRRAAKAASPCIPNLHNRHRRLLRASTRLPFSSELQATSALDTASEAVVTEALERVTAGHTTVVIAHRLSTVRGGRRSISSLAYHAVSTHHVALLAPDAWPQVQRADRIGVVVRGKLVEVGTHDELLRKGGVYAALVSQQGLAR